ncbi:MAG: GIY-YIG nuclease family protein [Armatimonadetes bacterium]|nr:GIY-YIG nuclease family protein [Armatimonadota bacterium]
MTADSDSGLYQLLLHLPQAETVTVGRLGTFDLAAGYYVYTGSALRARARRVARHRASIKPLRWHIDYLTTVATVVAVRLLPVADGECATHQQLCAQAGVTLPARGFGSSDCRQGCGSHLAYLGREPTAWPGPPNDAARDPRVAGCIDD